MDQCMIIDWENAMKKREQPKLYTSELIFFWDEEDIITSRIDLRFYKGASYREGNIITRSFQWSEPGPDEGANIIIFEEPEEEKDFFDAIMLCPEEPLYPEQFIGVFLEQPFLMLYLFDRYKRPFNIYQNENAFLELAHIRVTGRTGEFRASYLLGT